MLEALTLKAIAGALDGRLLGDDVRFSSVSTDSGRSLPVSCS